MPSNIKSTVSDACATTNDQLSEAGSQAKSKASDLGRSAAKTLGSTADSIREMNVMMVARLVKDNPGPALLCVAALGFLVARSLSND